MTTEVLNQKYAQLTGIRKPVSEIIEAATTADEKKATYDHLMWHIKNGVIRTGGKNKELVDAVIPALAEALQQSSTAEVIETYSQAEADTYNLGLPDSWAIGRKKTPTKEECNTYNETNFTGDNGYMTLNGPWAYDIQVMNQAVEEKLYTAESAVTHNATLTGALQAGTELNAEQATAFNTALVETGNEGKKAGDTLTADEAALYNATLEDAVKEGDVETAAKPVEYYSDGTVTNHNQAITGAYHINIDLGTYTDEEVYAHNATLPGAVKAGDNKPTQTNDNQEQNNQEG